MTVLTSSRVRVPFLVALVACALAACTPTPPPTTPVESPTASESPGRDLPRFLVTCFYPDGSEVGVFTRLDDAWASTNYVRIDYCEAAVADPAGFALTAEESAVADVAVAGLPGEDPTALYLRTLAACVRIPAEGDRGLETYPTPILEAALILCPEAPHAGLIEERVAAESGS